MEHVTFEMCIRDSVNPLLVFKTSPFSQTWLNLRNINGSGRGIRTLDTPVMNRML